MPTSRRSHPQRSLLAVVLALLAVVVGVWWFTFGELSPCAAMRAQARRIGTEKAGALGRVAAGALTELRAGDFTPYECAVAAVKLKLHGASALEDLIRHGLGSDRDR